MVSSSSLTFAESKVFLKDLSNFFDSLRSSPLREFFSSAEFIASGGSVSLSILYAISSSRSLGFSTASAAGLLPSIPPVVAKLLRKFIKLLIN